MILVRLSKSEVVVVSILKVCQNAKDNSEGCDLAGRAATQRHETTLIQRDKRQCLDHHRIHVDACFRTFRKTPSICVITFQIVPSVSLLHELLSPTCQACTIHKARLKANQVVFAELVPSLAFDIHLTCAYIDTLSASRSRQRYRRTWVPRQPQ